MSRRGKHKQQVKSGWNNIVYTRVSRVGARVSGLGRTKTFTESPAKPEFLPMAGVSGYLPLESPA
jgi:hypothetical protein